MEGDPHQLLLTVHPDGPNLLPQIGAAGLQKGGLGVVLELEVQNIPQLLLDFPVPDGAGDLHPPLEVAGHQVRGGNEIFGLVSPAKDIDPGVLQVAAHNAGDLDVLRLQKHPRADAADAPDDHLNLHPRLGGLPELVDDLPLCDGIGLDAEVALGALVNLLLDHGAQLGL